MIKLYIDNWIKNQDFGTNSVYDEINKIELTEIINKLNGINVTQIAINTDYNQNILLIGGGNGHYVVTFMDVYTNNSFSLNNPEAKGCILSINCGGQFGDYSDSIVVDINAAINAAEYFCLNGEKNSSQVWIDDNLS